MKPGPFETIRNIIYLLLAAFTFSATIKSENYKNTFTFRNYKQNPKRTLLFNISLPLYLLALVYFLAIYFLLFILFQFTNIEALWLTTTRWSWGTRQRTCFAGS
jgi:hypothetical protein